MNDRELVKRVQNGQKDYLNDIADRYYDDIFRFCCYQTGNQADAYDITQETFLKFIKYIDSYQYRNLKGYLLMICRNLCRDYFRERYKISEIRMEAEEELSECISVGAEDKNMEQASNRIMLEKYLKMLPEEQREVIILRFYSDLALLEIARVLGQNLSTVKTRLRLGLKRLKKIMEEQT